MVTREETPQELHVILDFVLLRLLKHIHPRYSALAFLIKHVLPVKCMFYPAHMWKGKVIHSVVSSVVIVMDTKITKS